MIEFLHNIKSHVLARLPRWKSRKKTLNYIRDLWNGTRAPERDLDLVSIFHDFKAERSQHRTVDDGTWDDLGMGDIFAIMDRTVSVPGRQYLYHQMRTYVDAHDAPDAVSANNHLYRVFKENPQLRERIQLLLQRLNNRDASYLPHLLFQSLPVKPRYFFFIRLSAFLCFLCSVTAVFIPPFLLLFFAFGIINLIIHHWYSLRIYEHFSSLSHLNTLLTVAHRLGDIRADQQVEPLTFLARNRRFIKTLSKRIGWLVIDKRSLPDLGMFLVEYLNQFYLFDILVFHRSMDMLTNRQAEIIPIFEAVARLDAAISVASFTNRHPYTLPVFNQTGKMEFERLYHPLLTDPVPNSISLDNRSVLITGSNMAGKTTFIRTIGINVILAQTVSICLAERAWFPPLEVKSFIKREDDLNSGKSYYFIEVEKILEFTRLRDKDRNSDENSDRESEPAGQRYLFLLDEIYKGTNTVERISISTAVLEYLCRTGITMAATHDIELARLLRDTYEMYHFSEVIDDGKYGFDYLLKQGPCRTRNAIRLLELTDYPETITRAAHKISKEIAR